MTGPDPRGGSEPRRMGPESRALEGGGGTGPRKDPPEKWAGLLERIVKPRLSLDGETSRVKALTSMTEQIFFRSVRETMRTEVSIHSGCTQASGRTAVVCQLSVWRA